jgi:RNA polymerase sigma-70 factor, ECF subfamily
MDYSKVPDEEIVKKVIAEDKELYSELMGRYTDKLLRYANFLTGNNLEMSADIVQESFIKAYINLQGFDTKKKLSSWIYRIVHNQAMNEIKKESRKTNLFDDMDLKSSVNLEEEFIKNELNELAQECFKGMPLKYSEPLGLYYLEEKSYQEISDILRLPINTVATRISRAKVYLNKICQNQKQQIKK